MMNRANPIPRYTGARVLAFSPPRHHAEGCCRACGQPSGECLCGCRECRKESRELLVESRAGANDKIAKVDTMMAEGIAHSLHGFSAMAEKPGADVPAAAAVSAAANAFIGGSCCVKLSIEYAPATPISTAIVLVVVADSEGTLLAWAKTEQPGTHYQIKEDIVRTKPGAKVALFAVNATARLRWCEVFSC